MVPIIHRRGILVRLVLNWKFLKIISRFCANLCAVGCITTYTHMHRHRHRCWRCADTGTQAHRHTDTQTHRRTHETLAPCKKRGKICKKRGKICKKRGKICKWKERNAKNRHVRTPPNFRETKTSDSSLLSTRGFEFFGVSCVLSDICRVEYISQ